MPLLEGVQQIYKSDPQRRPDLQKLLQEVWTVVYDCNKAIEKWSKPTGLSGVRRLEACISCPGVDGGVDWVLILTC